MAYVGPVGERHAILDPFLTEHMLGHQTFGVLAFIVFVGFALSLEVSCGALINYVAHFYDGTLYCVRRTEAKACITAAFAGGAVNIAYSGEGSNVHVFHLDRIKQAGPREAENIIVGVSVGVVGVGEVEMHGHVVHRRSLQVVPF